MQSVGILPFVDPLCCNAAFASVAAMGFRNIWLIGLDLGQKEEGRHHARDFVYYRPEHADLDEDYRRRFNRIVPGNFGGEVRTFWAFDLGRRMLANAQRHYRTALVNCSDGASIEGAQPKVAASVALPGAGHAARGRAGADRGPAAPRRGRPVARRRRTPAAHRRLRHLHRRAERDAGRVAGDRRRLLRAGGAARCRHPGEDGRASAASTPWRAARWWRCCGWAPSSPAASPARASGWPIGRTLPRCYRRHCAAMAEDSEDAAVVARRDRRRRLRTAEPAAPAMPPDCRIWVTRLKRLRPRLALGTSLSAAIGTTQCMSTATSNRHL